MDAVNLLKSALTPYIEISEADFGLFYESFQKKTIKKKHFLLQEGEINRGLSFVTQGILRSYAIDKNGYEHVLQFAPMGWWMGDMYSFTRQKPARFFIDALENVEILWLAKENLDILYNKIPCLDRFFRMLAENSLISYQFRLIGNLSLSSKERYTNFCTQYPSLIQQLPQKQIASYIGVTPEFFSKMLSEKKKS